MAHRPAPAQMAAAVPPGAAAAVLGATEAAGGRSRVHARSPVSRGRARARWGLVTGAAWAAVVGLGRVWVVGLGIWVGVGIEVGLGPGLGQVVGGAC